MDEKLRSVASLWEGLHEDLLSIPYSHLQSRLWTHGASLWASTSTKEARYTWLQQYLREKNRQGRLGEKASWLGRTLGEDKLDQILLEYGQLTLFRGCPHEQKANRALLNCIRQINSCNLRRSALRQALLYQECLGDMNIALRRLPADFPFSYKRQHDDPYCSTNIFGYGVVRPANLPQLCPFKPESESLKHDAWQGGSAGDLEVRPPTFEELASYSQRRVCDCMEMPYQLPSVQALAGLERAKALDNGCLTTSTMNTQHLVATDPLGDRSSLISTEARRLLQQLFLAEYEGEIEKCLKQLAQKFAEEGYPMRTRSLLQELLKAGCRMSYHPRARTILEKSAPENPTVSGSENVYIYGGSAKADNFDKHLKEFRALAAEAMGSLCHDTRQVKIGVLVKLFIANTGSSPDEGFRTTPDLEHVDGSRFAEQEAHSGDMPPLGQVQQMIPTTTCSSSNKSPHLRRRAMEPDHERTGLLSCQRKARTAAQDAGVAACVSSEERGDRAYGTTTEGTQTHIEDQEHALKGRTTGKEEHAIVGLCTSSRKPEASSGDNTVDEASNEQNESMELSVADLAKPKDFERSDKNRSNITLAHETSSGDEDWLDLTVGGHCESSDEELDSEANWVVV